MCHYYFELNATAGEISGGHVQGQVTHVKSQESFRGRAQHLGDVILFDHVYLVFNFLVREHKNLQI